MRVLLVGEGASELGGALESLVRRMGLAESQIDNDRVSRQDVHAHHGKGRGYFKRAVRWIYEARKRGYDALILVIDHDRYPERLREVTDAQEYAGISTRRALGVAVRTFDARMLSDEQALTNVLGRPISRQQDPESITDPKQVCRELLAGTKTSMGLVQMYASIAEVVDIETLATRCPKGFRPFSDRVRVLSADYEEFA